MIRKGQRIASFYLNPQRLLELAPPDAVPTGAAIVDVIVERDTGQLQVIVEHESFEPLPFGSRPRPCWVPFL